MRIKKLSKRHLKNTYSSRRSIILVVRVPRRLTYAFKALTSKRARWGWGLVALIVVLTEFIPAIQPNLGARAYALSDSAKDVIAKPNDSMAENLKYDGASQTYNFNANYSPLAASSKQVHAGGPEIKATLHQDLSKGLTITDPVNNVDFKMTPKFATLAGKQSKNQIQYPLGIRDASLVYTANAIGLKEDILLEKQSGDKLEFRYELGLGDQYVAKILDDGSLGIYGSSLPIGNISASTDKDAALLQKARQHAKKDKLIFIIPPPTIKASGDHVGNAQAKFSVRGNILTITATELKSAAYPLSIDPTVQISTTNEFYRNTSIESNADFDATNNQITRGAISGGTTGTWTATTTMNQGRFLAGATAYNGNIYVVGGSSAATTANLAGSNANMVEYASISTASPSVFGSWAAGNKTGLPAGGLSRFQLIGYHGFLYAIGGSTTDTTCTTLSSTVYYAPVQVNGVLGNWSTTSAPTTARCSFGAAAYGGKIYIAGGKTGAANNTGSADVSYATVNPDGTLTWTNNVSVTLPAARYGNDLQAYNGYLYVVGGNLNGTMTNTILYAALNSDGSIYGTGSTNWISTNVFATARENLGTVYSVIRNGYIYLSGGCSVLNASQTCTTVQSDTQLAQINADGSLGQWATTTSLTAARVGAAEVAWRGTVYNIAGCAAMNAASIFCTTPLASTQYGTVTAAGQASVLKTSANNLPVALFGGAAAVLNGYLYLVGGCKTNTCQTNPGGTSSDTSNQTYYAAINADGTLGAWGNVAANTIAGSSTTVNSGLAEVSLVAANGNLYALGGYSVSPGGGATAGNNSIYTVTPSPSTGALPGAWTLNGTTLASREYAMSALYFNSAIYTFGGCVASSATAFGCSTYSQAVTKYALSGANSLTIAAGSTTNLQALSAATVNFPNAAMGIAFYYGYVYLCGGANGNATANGGPQTAKCVYHKLTSNGQMTGAWSTTTGSLNQTIRRGQAYASNGYLYVYSGHNGQGTGNSVGDINIGKINAATGDVASFSLSTTAFTAKWDSGSAFADGNIYTVGGCVAGNPPVACTAGTGPTNKTEYFQIYNATNSGTRAITTSGNTISTAVAGNSTVAYNGYIYNTGGCSSYTVGTTTCTTAIGTSQFAAINPDGSIGAWATGPTLPASAVRGFGCMVALNGTLYYMGGATSGGTAQSDVYYSTATGSSWGSGTWVAVNSGGATGKLLAAKSGLSCATWNDRIYATGGSTSTTVYYSPSLPSGGDITSAWTATTTSFGTSRSYHSAVAAGGYLYIMGGFDGTNYLSDVQYAQIASSGDITATWSFTQDIPLKQRQMSAFAANGYIYLLGGATGTTSTSCLKSQDVASVNSDGTLGAWTPGVATSFTAALGSGVGYYNGYYYVVGGNDCTNNLTSVSYAGEQSQAIRSIFTRYIDFVGDATPWKFVVNGTNAAVNTVDIEVWRMTYSSSRAATNAFGANSIITPLSFGSNPVAISAIDGSSANQGVSQYWLLTFDIDQTSSFSFADTTSPPAIISYSFYYAPSGNTRLRNGRIFQDQTKQSLDAHP